MLDIGLSRRDVLKAMGVGATAAVAGDLSSEELDLIEDVRAQMESTSGSVVADPTDIPDPINRYEPKTHDVTLEAQEVTAEIEPGVEFSFMTYDGQIPGPMIRVRQGDTVNFTMKNLPDNGMPHNVDFHAVYGTGGGNLATTANPGEENGMRFKAKYPGAYIYHCAVPNLDYHISSGMFGMILVEPPEGLPPVDREFYLGQHEVYTDKPAGQQGQHKFDFDAMKREDPTYVLLNGKKYGLTPDVEGAMQAETGETARVYMVTGGPNLTSNFHPIGNVWTEAWREGAINSEPEEYVQTVAVPPGSCVIATMDFPVPERVKLVDHALSRVARKGLMAAIDVSGEKRTDIYDPEVDGEDEGPIYGAE